MKTDFYIGYWKENFFHVNPIGKIKETGEFCHKMCYDMSRLSRENYIQLTPLQFQELVTARRIKILSGWEVFPNMVRGQAK